jgi:hypothetical protein
LIFSLLIYANVSELVVSGPDSPVVSSVDDLAGKAFFVRRSSSYRCANRRQHRLGDPQGKPAA